MPDPIPPTTKPPTTATGSELPPRLLAKLKVEIDGYELIERLGEGGQATVYRAVQKKDGQMVAIKVLHAGPHATDEARARLKREINALRAINHPNIVHAIAAGRTRSGLDCLVMNFIDGKPLDALWADPVFAATVAPQSADLLRLFKTICETVQAAHRKGITHRDLSPSNILIDAHGQPHILDFGMASTAFDGIVTRNVTVTGQFIGKLKYASPEQARGAGAAGEGVDIRSDVYALGVMLYQLLTGGAFPYEVVGNVIDVLNNIIHSKPRPPSETVAELHTPTAAMVVPRSTAPSVSSAPVRRNPPLVNETIEAIVLKALEKEPEKRYQSAGELAADIDRYLAGQPTSATVWSKRTKPASRFSIRRRPILAAVSLILVVSLIGVTMNARTLAVWLGLTTVVAPVLTTDHTPLAPAPASAAVLETTQPEGGLTALRHLAEDLAGIDAKLAAVGNELTVRDGAKYPKPDRAASPPKAPLRYNAFVAKLCEDAKAAGRPVKIDIISEAEFDDLVKSVAAAMSNEQDVEALLALRCSLEAEQAALWARLAFGVFAMRDVSIQPIYTNKLKDVSPNGDDAAMKLIAKSKTGVLNAGVQVVRYFNGALKEASSSLKSGGAESGAPTSVGEVTVTTSSQVEKSIDQLRREAIALAGAAGATDAERQASNKLGETAQAIRESLQNVPDLAARADKASGEVERFRRRRELQDSLMGVASGGATLDRTVTELVKEWKAVVDEASRLTDVKLNAVATKTTKPAEKQEQGVAKLLPVGSTWKGTWDHWEVSRKFPTQNITGEITEIKGSVVSMKMTNDNGDWELKFEASNGTLRLLNGVPKTPGNWFLRNIDVSGELANNAPQRKLVLTGTWDAFNPQKPDERVVAQQQKFVFNLDHAGAAAKPEAVGIDIAKIVRGTWSGTKAQTSTPVNGNGRQDVRNDQIARATISRRANGSLELETVSADGTGRNHYILQVQGDTLTLDEGGCFYTGPSPRSFSNVRGKGTISESSIQLDFSFLCTPKTGGGAHTATASMTLTKDK